MKADRVNEIDFLRFIAALSVVMFHYTFCGYMAGETLLPYPLLAPVAKYGYLGVELFFMISGFVILMSADHATLQSFIISRMTRLYPAFWACCTITFVAIIALGASRHSATISQYLVNMTMLSNKVKVPSMDEAYWSLFVEMHFYLLVGIVLLTRTIHRAQTYLVLWLTFSIALQFFAKTKLHSLLLVDYATFFIAGAAFYMIRSQGLTFARGTIIVISWGLALFQSNDRLGGLDDRYQTHMNPLVVGTIVTIFFVVMFIISLRCTSGFSEVKWTVLGALTYPLYLLHQKVGYIVFDAMYGTINTHVILWGTIAGMLMAAYVIHTIIERPIALPFKNALICLARVHIHNHVPFRGGKSFQ